MQLQQEFIGIAKKFKNKIAVYDKTMNKEITYNKLLIASLLLSKHFSKYKGNFIGIMLPTSIGCMVSILGVLMCEKIPVMINYATGASENCVYAQEKCSFKNIITSKVLLEKLKVEFVEGMIYIEDIMQSITKFDKLKAAIKSKLPSKILTSHVHNGNEEKLSVILFTSGSEKNPKAVELSHKNILQNLNSVPKRFNIKSEDIFLGNLPLFHVFGLTTTFWLPLTVGASIVSFANPLEYKSICQAIKDYKITIMIATPSFFYGYLKKSNPGDFSSIKYAIAGADKLPHHVRIGYKKKHNIEILEGYGTTETSPVISVNPPQANKPGSIGTPLEGVQVKIVDRVTDEELPPNKEGKILVKGELVMRGYYGDLEETSLRIHNGWYDTGDMGIIDEDGYLWHRGRLRRFVKIGGEMVSLVKVENVLESLLPEEAVCCVVDVPNPTKGSDIVAAITTTQVKTKQIQKKMAKQLPSIAIPKEIHVLEEIPMMGSGKVNFREVEKICRKLENEKTN